MDGTSQNGRKSKRQLEGVEPEGIYCIGCGCSIRSELQFF